MDYLRDEDIPCVLSEATKQLGRDKAKREGGRFLKGPVPLPWLLSAGALPGKSMTVGIAIWYQSGLEKTRENIKICPSNLKPFGVQYLAGYRGLDQLEKAGLVSVVRHRGRCPRVTILVKVSK